MQSLSIFRDFSGGSILVPILVLICLWFILRELRNWYWKHNEMVSLLEKIERNTRKDFSSDSLNSAKKVGESSAWEGTSLNKQEIDSFMKSRKGKILLIILYSLILSVFLFILFFQ
jgi:hypothetical protein